MIRIAVVDDDPNSRAVLTGHLSRFETEFNRQFAVEQFADGAEITANYVPRFDIILLDVQMAHLDGFATARIIRETDPKVILIFITNMAQFAIKGYEVAALSYLLKPVSYFAFSQELKRCLERLDRETDDHVLLTIGGEIVRLDLARIIYVESVKHRLDIYTLDGKLSLIGTLKDLTERLAGRGFFRSNSCYLVNLRHVTGVRQSASQLTGGIELAISRARKKDFMDALTAYFGGQLA